MVKQTESGQFIKSFISGGIAGVCSKTLIAPIERVKYLFIRQFTYRQYLKDTIYIVRQNGVLNLWRGNIMSVTRIFPHAAIDFAVFDFLRRKYYVNDSSFGSKIKLFLCGATAGITALSCTTPLQFLRVRMAMEKDNFSYNGNIHAIKVVLAKEGWSGFYKGYTASVLGIFIYHGISFFIFAKLKQFIKTASPENYSKWYIDFLFGGVSAIGQLIAYPFDIVRKRMQGQHLLIQKNELKKQLNYRQLIKYIIEIQGVWNGFYKGISLNMIKAPLGAATAWTVKNHLNRQLDNSYDL